MIVTSKNPLLYLPLISTSRVLASGIALSYNSAVVFISVHFSARVFVMPNSASKGHVRCWVLKVDYSPLLGELLIGEVSISFVANSWLSKVNHVSFDAHSTESGAGELGECSSHAVAGHL